MKLLASNYLSTFLVAMLISEKIKNFETVMRVAFGDFENVKISGSSLKLL